MDLTLKKYTGLGNDYLIYDPNKSGQGLTNAHIQLVCNRNFGLGSDGILVGPLFEDGRICVRTFNPDGSEAEKSGNGLMIFARYLKEEGYVSGQSVTIGTPGGEVTVEYLDARAETLRVNMGRVSFWSDDIPVVGEDIMPEPRKYIMASLEHHKVGQFTNARVSQFFTDGAAYTSTLDGSTHELRGYDSIVLAMGYRSNNTLSAELEKLVPQVIVIGEARQAPGNSMLATGDALNAALAI